MTARLVRLLHVEVDETERRLVRSLVDRLPMYRFAITYASSEDAAVETFRAGYDFVILDYALSDGDGSACMKRIRQIDGSVPIVVLSSPSTPVVEADLLEAGADDHFSKEQLEADSLGQSVHAALARSDAWRNRAPDVDPELMRRIKTSFEEICATYLDGIGPHFVDRLESLECDAREAHLTVAQTLRLFEKACDKLGPGDEEFRVKQLLRPVMFEVIYRLYNQAPEPIAV